MNYRRDSLKSSEVWKSKFFYAEEEISMHSTRDAPTMTLRLDAIHNSDSYGSLAAARKTS